MISEHFRFAYRILRSFHAAGVNVHVLGARGSRGLRYSRFCASFQDRVSSCSGDLGTLIEEVNALVVQRGIDLVIAGDHAIMRPLIVIAQSLKAPCFPMPKLEQFDLLNSKWSFTQLCQSLGLRCPRSQLFPDRSSLKRAIESGEVATPLIAKPLDCDGGRGVLPVLQMGELRQLDAIQYEPILVQEYIDGEDVAASVFCDHGKIRAFIAHKRKSATYFTLVSPEIRAGIEKIAAATKAQGVLNFDLRVGFDGALYWLECNPRFFFWIHMSMLAGVPFAEFGLPNWPISGANSVPSGTDVRCLRASAIELLRPWRLTRRDFAYLGFVLADPVPWAREALGLEFM
jgi:biotin carboxylase